MPATLFDALASEDRLVVASHALQRSAYLRAEQRFVTFAQVVHLLIQVVLCKRLVLVDQVFLKELQAVMVTA